MREGAPTPAQHFWSRADGYIRTRLRPDLYDRWFAPLRPVGMEGEELRVAAPTEFHRDFLAQNYGDFFSEVTAHLFDRRLRVVLVVAGKEEPVPAPPRAAAADEEASSPARLSVAAPALPDLDSAAPGREPGREPRPNPRYTFDTYVVGESNRFAFAACQAVASKPGKNYNPLFVHGESGLGKTHLLHAIANHILAHDPGVRVAILSSERYTNEFVESLSRGANAMAEFRRKYRGCGTLLLDDVQFLAGREKTAEEFFHTFNALHEHEVQIVLSSDRPPNELKELQDRMVSRFNWGMRVEIGVPEFETRSAILRKKAAVEGLDLPQSVASLLATYIKSNVRELEGALMRVSAQASMMGLPITDELARAVLKDVIRSPDYKPTIEQIQEQVAKYYKITVAKLTSPNREQKVAQPRQIAMYLCRTLAKATLQEIADKFNKKDHTTVMAAEKRVRELIGTDHEAAAAVAALTAILSP